MALFVRVTLFADKNSLPVIIWALHAFTD